MKKFISIISIFTFALCAYCAQVSDIVSYKNGDSMAWYHELIRDAFNKDKSASAEQLVLTAIKDKNTSAEAFRLSCKILKVCAGDKTLQELAKFAEDPTRSTPAFDVLISAPQKSVDAILLGILKSSKNANALAQASYALASRGNQEAVVPIFELAKKSDGELANIAIISLGHIASSNSIKALVALAKNKKYDAFLLNNALSELREAFIAKGDVENALAISISEDFRPALLSLSKVRGIDAGIKAMDKNIASENENAKYAARIANSGRTFENSGELLKAYKNLSDGAKIAAIRSFAMSKDKRFYPTIASDVKDSESTVNLEAIYACEFIGTDDSVGSLLKILPMANSKDKRSAAVRATEYALSRMPNEAVDKILKTEYAKTKSPILLEILLVRGNKEFNGELIKRILDSSDPNSSEILKISDNQLGYGNIEPLAKAMQKADVKGRDNAFKTIVKFIARDRDEKFRKTIVEKYLSDVQLSDKEKELIEARLLAKKVKKK